MLVVQCRRKKYNETRGRKAGERVTVGSLSCRMLYDCLCLRYRQQKISPLTNWTKLATMWFLLSVSRLMFLMLVLVLLMSVLSMAHAFKLILPMIMFLLLLLRIAILSCPIHLRLLITSCGTGLLL